jgi:hypothetical protein
VLRSTDRGATWTTIAGDLPPRDAVYSIAEDHEQPTLLFVGTEFGAYVSLSGGGTWLRLRSGVPTIAVRDIDIQRREDDLVLGTFGRGIYILDDYSPLRYLTPERLAAEAALFPVKDALSYVEANRLGGRNGRGWQGSTYYAAPNPPLGAVFTYYLKDKLLTPREQRLQAEAKAEKEGVRLPYPSLDDFRKEDRARDPAIVLIVSDAAGNVVRRVSGPREKGIHRVAWDLRFPATTPVTLKPGDPDPWDDDPSGPLVLPGTYSVHLAREVDGEVTVLAGPESFRVIPLELATLAAQDKEAALAFKQKVARLQRAVEGALRSTGELGQRAAHVRAAVPLTPVADAALLAELEQVNRRLTELNVALRGDPTAGRRGVPEPPSISERVRNIAGSAFHATSAPTGTQQDGYEYAADAFTSALAELHKLHDELAAIEKRLEAAGAPWTPGRLPTWKKE